MGFLAPRTTQARPALRLAGGQVPLSECQALWENLLQARQLQPPTRVGNLAQIDRYQILQELGSGGMGVVFLARDPLDSAATDPHSRSGLVAIKVPRPELAADPRARERFLSEARHLQQFDHPHILRPLDIRTSADHPFLVMPHFSRGSLAQHLRRHGALPSTEILTFALQMASALLHAHTHGIIHRDLKPANVLLNDQGQAVLTDFGLARSVFNDCIPDITREHREGTAPYMSPAVARGEAEDTRCDIYGLGALLYEMLSGRPPYTGRRACEVTTQILDAPPPPIDRVNPKASPALAQVAAWAMARELRHRYAHMVDVLSDLQRIAAGLDPLGPHEILPAHGLARRRLKALRHSLIARAALPLVLLLAGATWCYRHRGGAHLEHPATPAAHPPQPAPQFLLAGRELLMLQTDTPPHVHIVHRYRLPWLKPLTDAPTTDTARIDLLSDVDRDGREELILRTGTTADGRFQTLACFDVTSERLRWVQHEPGGFLPPALVETDNGTVREILVVIQTNAPGPLRARLASVQGRFRPATLRSVDPVFWKRRSLENARNWEWVLNEDAGPLLAYDAEEQGAVPATSYPAPE